jgi:HD-GYP domain-containing protein (c-di-GMP phosphodiesterase class II)
MGSIAEWIGASHEHFDGSGYPEGLAGDAIPMESRVLLVADALDAITSPRPYRDARDPEQALAELQRCAGAQFDPECVRALAEMISTNTA